jgi:hypothetical protein
MEATFSSETSLEFQWTAHYIPEDSTLHNHRCENLKSYILYIVHSWKKGSSGSQKWLLSTVEMKADTSRTTPICFRWLQVNITLLTLSLIDSLPVPQVHKQTDFRTQHLTPLRSLLAYGAQPFLRSRQLCSHSRTSQHFMEPEGSLPCPQQPSTGP